MDSTSRGLSFSDKIRHTSEEFLLSLAILYRTPHFGQAVSIHLDFSTELKIGKDSTSIVGINFTEQLLHFSKKKGLVNVGCLGRGG